MFHITLLYIGDISSPTNMAVLVIWNKSPKRDINPNPCSIIPQLIMKPTGGLAATTQLLTCCNMFQHPGATPWPCSLNIAGQPRQNGHCNWQQRGSTPQFLAFRTSHPHHLGKSGQTWKRYPPDILGHPRTLRILCPSKMTCKWPCFTPCVYHVVWGPFGE